MQRAQALFQTNIGKKAIVAVTGLILFGFVIVHLLGNLQVFLGREVLNAYAAGLHENPKLVWGVRLVLLASVVLHLALTMSIARQANAARPSRYRAPRPATSFESENILRHYARVTMRLSGPILAAYIVFHLLHLTVGANVGVPFTELHAYENLIYSFRVPWLVVVYVIANGLLCLHLYHGGQALLQTLGLRHPRWDTYTQSGALGLALFVGLGNCLIPLAIVLRLVGQDIP